DRGAPSSPAGAGRSVAPGGTRSSPKGVIERSRLPSPCDRFSVIEPLAVVLGDEGAESGLPLPHLGLGPSGCRRVDGGGLPPLPGADLALEVALLLTLGVAGGVGGPGEREGE